MANFLKTFAGETDAKRLLYTASVSQQRAETRTEYQSPATPDDDPNSSCRTPQSDVSGSPVPVDEDPHSLSKSSPLDSHSKAGGPAPTPKKRQHPSNKRPSSPARKVARQHKLARSQSLEPSSALTEQRLRILSSVRNARESLIRSVEPASAPSSPRGGQQFSFSAPSSPTASRKSEIRACAQPVLELFTTLADNSRQAEKNCRSSRHLESDHLKTSDAGRASVNSANEEFQEENPQATCLKEADTSCQPTSVPRILPTGFRAH